MFLFFQSGITILKLYKTFSFHVTCFLYIFNIREALYRHSKSIQIFIIYVLYRESYFVALCVKLLYATLLRVPYLAMPDMIFLQFHFSQKLNKKCSFLGSNNTNRALISLPFILRRLFACLFSMIFIIKKTYNFFVKLTSKMDVLQKIIIMCVCF